MSDIQETIAKAQHVLDRLQEVIAEQGLKITINRLEGEVVFLDVERYAKGAPTVFMIKAIGGTYRRYVPEIREAAVANFHSNINGADSEPQSTDVSNQDKPLFDFMGLPELDLTATTDNRQITLALENFSALVLRHNRHKFRVSWKNNRQAATIVQRWCQSENACCHKQDKNDDIYIVHIPAIALENHDVHCGLNEKGDILPAGIMLTMPVPKKKEQ